MTLSTNATAVVAIQDAHESIERLGCLLAGRHQSAELLPLLDGLASALDRFSSEQTGLAEELLCSYEQLGIVFEVTKRLSSVKTEAEVIDLFTDSLVRSFSHCDVFIVKPAADGAWREANGRLKIDPAMHETIERAAKTCAVVVEPHITDDGSGNGEVLVACLHAGQAVVCANVLIPRGDAAKFRAADMMLMESLSTFCGDLIEGRRLLAERRQACTAMVRALVNAVDQKDTYTSGHSSRVAFYATLLGERTGLNPKDLQMLQWSALLHDVGKIGIRDDVLKKTGKLTEEEFRHMNEHPVRSHQVVKAVPELRGALAGVLHHHEHFDGGGYPDGLCGTEIPLQARVIQVADIFDALTSNRAYRSAFDWDRALRILGDESGTTVDPDLATMFDGLIRSRLQDDPSAWERMTREANEFTQLQDDLVAMEEGA